MSQPRSRRLWFRCCAIPSASRLWALPAGVSSSAAIRGFASPLNSKPFVKRSCDDMNVPDKAPSVVLICHENDTLDREGLASWIADRMNLIGLVVTRDGSARLWRVARWEIG